MSAAPLMISTISSLGSAGIPLLFRLTAPLIHDRAGSKQTIRTSDLDMNLLELENYSSIEHGIFGEGSQI